MRKISSHALPDEMEIHVAHSFRHEAHPESRSGIRMQTHRVGVLLRSDDSLFRRFQRYFVHDQLCRRPERR